MREFKIGFTGAALTEAIEWIDERTDAKSICVPFAGSCKVIAALAKPGVTIESWDTQIISRAIVEGVFNVPEIETAIDKPRYKKGHMYETRAIAGIDERCAGFIDYVGAHGTLADKVAIFSSVVRSSNMGRMTEWSKSSGMAELWYKFEKNRDYLAQFTNLPGTFIHHEASVFETVPVGPYDLLHVDPPKVVSSSDIYSANYQHLNIALGGKCEVPKWGWRDTVGYMRNIFKLDAETITLLYVSDVTPTLDTLKKVLSDYATIQDVLRLLHRARYDYTILARKEGK